MQERTLSYNESQRKRSAMRQEQTAGLQMRQEETVSSFADREEYHGMLEAAKDMRDEHAFLLIKLFANTGIYIRDLGLLTVETARVGTVKSGKRAIHLPPGLCEELLGYADFYGKTGMIFGTRYGHALQEPRIAVRLKKVSKAAGMADGMGTARGLQELYWNTRRKLEAEGTSDVDRAMDDLFEREQTFCGWGV